MEKCLSTPYFPFSSELKHSVDRTEFCPALSGFRESNISEVYA